MPERRARKGFNLLHASKDSEGTTQASKAYFDQLYDFFIKTVQVKSDKQGCLAKADRMLRKASKMLSGLVYTLCDDSYKSLKEQRQRKNKKPKKHVPSDDQEPESNGQDESGSENETGETISETPPESLIATKMNASSSTTESLDISTSEGTSASTSQDPPLPNEESGPMTSAQAQGRLPRSCKLARQASNMPIVNPKDPSCFMFGQPQTSRGQEISRKRAVIRDPPKQCANAMYKLQYRLEHKAKPTEQDSQKPSSAWNPKTSNHLKKSELYQENNLSYQDLDKLFRQSESVSGFALSVMLHVFVKSELKACDNTYGRAARSTLTTMSSLDLKRVDLIRQIIEQNFSFDNTVWHRCVVRMNAAIRKLKDK